MRHARSARFEARTDRASTATSAVRQQALVPLPIVHKARARAAPGILGGILEGCMGAEVPVS